MAWKARLCVVVCLVATLATTEPTMAAVSPELDKLVGLEVVFLHKSPSLQKYGYQLVYQEPKGLLGSESLPYERYAGKKGTLRRVVKGPYRGDYWEIELENGEMVYSAILSSDSIGLNNFYFVAEYESARRMIGDHVWVDRNKWEQGLLTEEEAVSYPLDHFERVEILEIVPLMLGHAKFSRPYLLRARKDNGDTGFIGSKNIQEGQSTFVTENPVDPTWSPEVIAAIKSRSWILGMTKEQALVSWGPPDDRRRTITKEGTSEQWQYGERVLSFENDQLVAYQD